MLVIPQDIILDISSANQNGIFVIYLSLVSKPHICPFCCNLTSRIKEYKIKHIKHSLLNRQQCMIHYKSRRYLCDLCGKSFSETNPFSPKGHSISNLTVLNVLNKLKESNATFASVAKHNFISQTKAQEIFDLYVHIPRKSFPEIICIDEVYALKDNHSKYVCLLLDFKSHELIDMLPERKKYSLLRYFDRISLQERSHVRFFIMDMYYTYRDVIHARFPSARIAVDSFHVIMNINKALDNIRIRVMKVCKKDSIEYYLLKNFKWLLLEKEVRENKRKFNKRLNRYINYPQLLDLILKSSSELNEAYLIKDRYVLFNSCSDFYCAEKDFYDVLSFIRRSKIPELISVYKMLNNWSDEILNSFIVVNGKRLSNGIMEYRNSIVKLIKKIGNGYVNFARFRNRCMYLSGNTIPIKMKGHKRGSYKKHNSF